MNLFKIRLPEENKVFNGASELLIENIDDNILKGDIFSGKNGFIYSEFKEFPEIFLIPADNIVFTDKECDEWTRENDRLSVECFPFASASPTRSQHIITISKLKAKTLEWRSAGENHPKVIASRVSGERCYIPPSELFRRLCSAYPNACVFLFSTSLHGTWIGASPEMILNVTGNELHTISLAGTRWPELSVIDGKLNTLDWDEKNLEEQKIVTDFIVSALQKFGFDSETNGPFTLKAGPVEHLATEISANRRPEDFKLLRYLCPSPALSGNPRKEAIAAISEFETYPRQCYGGLIGLINANRDYFTFANLRSGRFCSQKNIIELHAGGGITPLSDSLKEWEETENKLSTLRKYIQ